MGDNDLSSIHRAVCDLSVRMNISNTNDFFYATLNMHLLQSIHKSCEVLWGSNLKWPTYCYFCLLKLTKYLKSLSVQMNISNTNEHFFPILYTCINYNPPMNPVNFRQDQMLTKNQNICFRYFTHAFTTVLPWTLITYNQYFTWWEIPLR